jgi:hypothetical protein
VKVNIYDFLRAILASIPKNELVLPAMGMDIRK